MFIRELTSELMTAQVHADADIAKQIALLHRLFQGLVNQNDVGFIILTLGR